MIRWWRASGYRGADSDKYMKLSIFWLAASFLLVKILYLQKHTFECIIGLLRLKRGKTMDSILRIDIPVQRISCTDTNGRITPMRFRFIDKTGELITVTIEKILKSEQDISRIGAEYQCAAVIRGMQKTFSLRYNYTAHAWYLSKMSV